MKPTICTNCGDEIDPIYMTCPNCHYPVQDEPEDPAYIAMLEEMEEHQAYGNSDKGGYQC